MDKKVITLNCAESNIYDELLKARNAWYEIEAQYKKDHNIATLELVNIACNRYLEYRKFVMRAFKVNVQFIEELLNGDIEVIPVC